jgi:hypothetical protein
MSRELLPAIAPVDPEVLPSTELQGLSEALGELYRARTLDLPELAAAARRWVIKTPADYINAGGDLKKIDNIDDMGENNLRPFLNKVNEVRTFLLGAIKSHRITTGEARKPLADKMAEFNRLAEEARLREQREIDEHNRIKAQEEAARIRKQEEEAAKERKILRVAEIKIMLRRKECTKKQAEKWLREANATEEADVLKAEEAAEQIAANPVQQVVQSNRVAVAGISARAPLVWRVVDIDAIPRHLLYPNRNKDGEFVCADFPRITQAVKNAKTPEAAMKEVPGIEVKREHRV